MEAIGGGTWKQKERYRMQRDVMKEVVLRFGLNLNPSLVSLSLD